MSYVRRYDPKKWVFKKTYMENNCHTEFPRIGDPSLLDPDNMVDIIEVFENDMPLALNQWIGLWRVTEIDGAYTQYLTSVVANRKDRAVLKVREAIRKEIREEGGDL